MSLVVLCLLISLVAIPTIWLALLERADNKRKATLIGILEESLRRENRQVQSLIESQVASKKRIDDLLDTVEHLELGKLEVQERLSAELGRIKEHLAISQTTAKRCFMDVRVVFDFIERHPAMRDGFGQNSISDALKSLDELMAMLNSLAAVVGVGSEVGTNESYHLPPSLDSGGHNWTGSGGTSYYDKDGSPD